MNKWGINNLWAWPLLIGFFTLSGLLTGLVSENLGDIWSWLGLLIPVLVSSFFGMKGLSR